MERRILSFDSRDRLIGTVSSEVALEELRLLLLELVLKDTPLSPEIEDPPSKPSVSSLLILLVNLALYPDRTG